MKFKKFFLQRVLAWALTILIGVTFIFFIPRMFPSDPVENMIAQIQSRSGNMDPAEMTPFVAACVCSLDLMARCCNSMVISCGTVCCILTLVRH